MSESPGKKKREQEHHKQMSAELPLPRWLWWVSVKVMYHDKPRQVTFLSTSSHAYGDFEIQIVNSE